MTLYQLIMAFGLMAIGLLFLPLVASLTKSAQVTTAAAMAIPTVYLLVIIVGVYGAFTAKKKL